MEINCKVLSQVKVFIYHYRYMNKSYVSHFKAIVFFQWASLREDSLTNTDKLYLFIKNHMDRKALQSLQIFAEITFVNIFFYSQEVEEHFI